jgi:uncharacterized protein (DUF849 family)
MNKDVIITCAVTGAGDTVGKHPAIPVTPAQIADAAIEAARAGAAVAHIHVRDPETGKFSRDPALYAEVVERIRASATDVIINLTAGMGGDFELGETDPKLAGPNTDLVGPLERLVHVEQLRPEICTLDCGTLNFGDGNTIYISTPDYLRTGAARVQQLGVKPELEIFDTGHLWFAKQMLAEGLLDAPPLFQFCLGIPWGAPADTVSMKAMADNLPPGAIWAAFGIGRSQMPMVAQAVLLGGHVRVGLEDNLYLDRGVFASNGTLVDRAVKIIELMGARVVTPAEARAEARAEATPMSGGAAQHRNRWHRRRRRHWRRLGGALPGAWARRAGLGPRAPHAEAQLRAKIANAWPALARVGLAGRRRSRRACASCADLDDAVRTAPISSRRARRKSKT